MTTLQKELKTLRKCVDNLTFTTNGLADRAICIAHDSIGGDDESLTGQLYRIVGALETAATVLKSISIEIFEGPMEGQE